MADVRWYLKVARYERDEEGRRKNIQTREAEFTQEQLSKYDPGRLIFAGALELYRELKRNASRGIRSE